MAASIQDTDLTFELFVCLCLTVIFMCLVADINTNDKAARKRERGRYQRRLAGGAIGGQAHCNGWNGINGTESNVVSICPIRSTFPFQPLQ
jgi:hypothetical protein